MGTFTITSGQIIIIQTQPSVDNSIVQLMVTDYVGTVDFTEPNFTTNYQDAENDLPNNVRITSLPSNGTLFNGIIPISINDIIPLTDIQNLRYVHNDSVEVSDSQNYSFTEDLATEIQNLESQGYTLTSNTNGVLTYFREEVVLTDDLIAQNVDGTFDTVEGFITNSVSDGAGNVDGGGWENGSGTADVIRPHTVAEGGVARGVPPSPQGGNFAAAVADSNASLAEELFTNISVENGQEYRVTFYQVHAGHSNVFENSVGDSANWIVSLGSQTINSSVMDFEGYGNQTWEEQTLVFTASTDGIVRLSFRANDVSGGNIIYVGVDNIQIRGQVVNSSTDTQTFTGTPVNDSFQFQTSDNNPDELYSNVQTMTIQ